MLTIAENKRLSGAAALTTLLLLIIGFGLGRMTDSPAHAAAPSQNGRLAVLQTQVTRLQSAQSSARAQLASLQATEQQDRRLHTTNQRLAGQIDAARRCIGSHRPRVCLRQALR